jgi:m7GpppX diphosphatase
MLDAGATQATGKAMGMDNVISQLQGMGLGDAEADLEKGMADMSLTYTLGEESELWRGVFSVLKTGGVPWANEG